MEWCREPERGLLRPDRVFYLTVGAEVASQRGDFGAERYEKKDFQAKVATMFDKLKDDSWTVSSLLNVMTDYSVIQCSWLVNACVCVAELFISATVSEIGSATASTYACQ